MKPRGAMYKISSAIKSCVILCVVRKCDNNNFFYFLKFIFDISISKRFKNIKNINLKQKTI